MAKRNSTGSTLRWPRAGQALMPVGNYGFSRTFGWVKDRFGVSWQLNLV
jgi:predicted 3-demethylubiquinone-9 3-methyltransferase (glyoxalase superfamily)